MLLLLTLTLLLPLQPPRPPPAPKSSSWAKIKHDDTLTAAPLPPPAPSAWKLTLASSGHVSLSFNQQPVLSRGCGAIKIPKVLAPHGAKISLCDARHYVSAAMSPKVTSGKDERGAYTQRVVRYQSAGDSGDKKRQGQGFVGLGAPTAASFFRFYSGEQFLITWVDGRTPACCLLPAAHGSQL